MQKTNYTDKKTYTLYAILNRIRDILEGHVKNKLFWVKAELTKINFHNSGHCYLELVETKDGKNIAQCRASIWKTNLQSIQTSLGSDFSNVIKQGNEVLFLVEVQFTERYGLNIIIKDIDISFSIGALEKKKQENIERLKKEQLLDKNKQHKLPVVIQKIAIIGSPETAGITDLKKQLDSNSYDYKFQYDIFPCLVQGDNAENEIIKHLKKLNSGDYDVIALIRGGGSKLDLDVFNSYNIAKEIALHSKPVFTGIGHETDVSVVDMVANVYHKTPTALGSYIVERAHNFWVKILTTYNYIIEYKNRFLENKKSLLSLNIQTLTSKSISITQLKRGDLHSKMNRILADANHHISREKNLITRGFEIVRLNPMNFLATRNNSLKHTIQLIQINSEGKIKQGLEKYSQMMDLVISYSHQKIADRLRYLNNVIDSIKIYHPHNILTKGYAIPKIDGKLITDQTIKENTELEIELHKRTLLVKYIKDTKKWKDTLMNRLLKS